MSRAGLGLMVGSLGVVFVAACSESVTCEDTRSCPNLGVDGGTDAKVDGAPDASGLNAPARDSSREPDGSGGASGTGGGGSVTPEAGAEAQAEAASSEAGDAATSTPDARPDASARDADAGPICAADVCGQACARLCEFGEPCEAAPDCNRGVCVDGECRPPCSKICEMGETCFEDADCKVGTCVDGQCRPECSGTCELGGECVAGDDCAEAICTDGSCRSACSPDCGPRKECVAADDCATAICTDGTCRPDCGRQGDEKGTCRVGNVCAAADDCEQGVCTGGTCRPECSPNCEPGDECVGPVDCGAGATCHATAKICAQAAPCPGKVVTTAADLNDIKYCTVITGDLTILPDFGVIDESALPVLERIDGSLQVSEDTEPITRVVFPALKTVGQGIALTLYTAMESIEFPVLRETGTLNSDPSGTTTLFTVSGRIESLSLPRLETVHSVLSIGAQGLTRIALPKLKTITSTFVVAYATDLRSWDTPLLETVSGDLILLSLPSLPYTAVQFLNQGPIVVGTAYFTDVGCCTISTRNCSTTFACGG